MLLMFYLKKYRKYINSDANSRGFLDAGGSHALETLMDEISKEVIDPQTSISVFERQKAEKIVNQEDPIARPLEHLIFVILLK